MFNNGKNWYKGLGKVGKVALWSVTAVLTGTAINAAASPKPADNQAKKPESNTVQSVKEEPVITIKTITETSDIAYAKSSVNDGNLEKGKTAIKTAGVNGIKTFTYEVTYKDGTESEKKLIKEEITTAPVTEVTSIGTKIVYMPPKQNCDPNYTPCVPNVSYDLDCHDIGFSVTVIGSDPHRFDRDGDGYGCESY